jgi:hypothetical protein
MATIATAKQTEAEWASEPDAKSFTDEETGYEIQITRGPGGHLCGYVGIPASHQWFGKNYNDTVRVPQSVISRTIDVDKVGAINLLCASLSGNDPQGGSIEMVLALDVHGGLSFTAEKAPSSEISGLWWIGFDCAHAGDYSPSYGTRGFMSDGVYRNLAYVEAECRSLAKQLSALSGALS